MQLPLPLSISKAFACKDFKLCRPGNTEAMFTLHQIVKEKLICEQEQVLCCVADIKATSHLKVRITVMRVTVNEVSSHLCKILTIIIVKTYLQTGKIRYFIARRPVVTCQVWSSHSCIVYSKWSCAFLDLQSGECTCAQKSTCFVSRIIKCDYNFPVITPFSVGCFSGGRCRTDKIKASIFGFNMLL